MSLNDHPTEIAFILVSLADGMQASPVINAVTGQELSVVSKTRGHHHRPGEQGNGAFAHGPGDDHRHGL